MTASDLVEWSARLDALLGSGGTAFDRAVVLAECESTQDEARRLARGRGGLIVVARRQTRGRGRLGRAWEQGGKGVAATFVLDAPAHDPRLLALVAGVAAADAVEAALAGVPGVRIGLRWPNDVVVSGAGGAAAGDPPKIAGCLVERKDALALVGIGINVVHARGDFPPQIADRCVSLAMLGAAVRTLDTVERLVVSMGRALDLAPPALVERWSARDTLVGTSRTFEHGARRFTGRVVAVDPLGNLRLITGSGPIDLPAATTSLVPVV